MKQSTPAPVKPASPVEVLQQLDIRVGTIELVAEVPGSDKLVELRVSFGDHTRQILVGMKQERANPRELEGRQALFVVNLAPRKMAGRVSEGMLLDIGYADGLVPVLAVPERPVPPGTRAG
jgi:tRNA-binding protein